ncbi:hypothetical protein EMPG_12502 [Blastomyces silverae]|uniref:Uncharacterized protein n=1 Tax=Blastomyces silverae TaxID=2060906 RepID=A0A0H1BMX3_9EURO|nr:hypothetical protein EMPG_12502 [Blastomyces silverae]
MVIHGRHGWACSICCCVLYRANVSTLTPVSPLRPEKQCEEKEDVTGDMLETTDGLEVVEDVGEKSKRSDGRHLTRPFIVRPVIVRAVSSFGDMDSS